MLLENVVYPVQALESRPRSKQMKVLALGLSRTGTDSLRIALETLGYDHVYHGFDVPNSEAAVSKAWVDLGRRKWGPGSDNRPITVEDLDRLLGHCEATTDQPCACFALELISAYPDAKVILNYREPESWYESIRATFGRHFASWEFRCLSHFEPSLYWLKQVFIMYEHGYYQGSMLRNGRRIHHEHYATIRGAVAKDRLLEWRVEDGWNALCDFLEKPVPKGAFPRGNNPEQLEAKAKKVRASRERKAYSNLAWMVVLIVGVMVHVVWLISLSG